MSHKALIEAIEQGEGGEALRLLEADPSLCRDADEPSALLLSLYRAQFHIAETIADRRKGLTVFEAAAIGDERALADHLAATGAPNAVAADGFTPLHLASFFGREGAVRLLLDAGADSNVVAQGPGMCPLHSAAASRSLPIVEMLLAAGADPDARQPGGYTALHSAARHGDADMAAALLEAGADPSLAGEEGTTAAEFARGEGHRALADKLAALNPASSARPRS